MLQRHGIQVLLGAGHTQKAVAEHCGVSISSVGRIAREAPVDDLDDDTVRRDRRVGRPSKARSFAPLIRALLRHNPKMQGKEVIRRMEIVGYDGGSTAAYDVIKEIRATAKRFVMLFEALPGEFSQHDFGTVWITFTDGSRKKVKFFGTRLKYSRWVEVTLVEDETAETLLRTLVSHLQRIGGMPLLAVFDRPKTVAVKWLKDGTVTQWNETFAKAMFEFGMGVELCWPYSPQQKGSVERLVGWVKSSFFDQREFVDMEDLRQQLAEWLWEVNRERVCRATGERPIDRMAAEQARLRPLRIAPADVALAYPIQVGPMAEVLFRGCRYAMHPEALGLPGTLYLYENEVRIVAGRWETLHDRLWELGSRSVQNEQFQQRVAAVSGRRGKHYLMRQHLLDLGEVATDYITELVYRRHGQWYGAVKVLHDLLIAHGPDAMRSALNWALLGSIFEPDQIREHLLQSMAARQEQLL